METDDIKIENSAEKDAHMWSSMSAIHELKEKLMLVLMLAGGRALSWK